MIVEFNVSNHFLHKKLNKEITTNTFLGQIVSKDTWCVHLCHILTSQVPLCMQIRDVEAVDFYAASTASASASIL